MLRPSSRMKRKRAGPKQLASPSNLKNDLEQREFQGEEKMKYQKAFRHISAVALAAAFLSAIVFTTVASGQSKAALQGVSPAMNWSRELLKRADVQHELG